MFDRTPLPITYYAQIVDGRVAQLVPISGPSIYERGLPADFLAALVEVVGDLPAVGDIATAMGGAWTFVQPATAPEDVQAARTRQQSALRAYCSTAITKGFACDALGEEHTYPFSMTDQANLYRAVVASQASGSTLFWCADPAGIWEQREHTAEQIQKVSVAADAHVLACQARLSDLTLQLSGAASIEAVHAITW